MLKSEPKHVLIHGNIPKIGLDLPEFFAMNPSADFPLFEDGEAFIEPEVAPVFASNVIAGPGVSDFMSSHEDL